MSNSDLWGAINGSLTDCGSYACLSKDTSAASYMYITTRFTTNLETSRTTPTLTVIWRESGSGSGGQIRLRARYNKVNQDGTNGTLTYIWGDYCTDTHADGTWETCSYTFDLGLFTVQDIRFYIYDYSGTINVDDVRAADGPG